MKINKLKEVIDIVVAANEADERRLHRDVPSSAADISIGAGIAHICFSSLRATAVTSLVDAGFEVQVCTAGASVYWREEE